MMVRFEGSGPTPSPSPNPAAQAALDAINGMSSSTSSDTSGSSNNPVLYWGTSDNMSGQRARREKMGQPEPKTSDRYTTMSDAQAEFYRWSVADRKAWGDYLVNLGLLTPDQAADYTTLQKQWLAAIDESVNFHAAGKQVNPWQAAAMMAGVDNPGSGASSKAASGGSGAKAAGFTGTKTGQSTSVDLTDPATAKALVNDVLSQKLGRAATDEEIRAFTNVLHTAEQSNPTVQNVTDTYVNGDNTSSTSTSSGGLSAAGKQQVVSDAAMQKPEYGSYQAATTYYNALLSAIASPTR